MSALINAQLSALAHPTRRAILRRVLTRELSAGKLASAFPVTRPAISQHIRVLVEARLLEERREQQRRLYRANSAAIDSLRAAFDDMWAGALLRLKHVVEADVRESGAHAKPPKALQTHKRQRRGRKPHG